MSEWNILAQKALDLKFFGIQNILGDQNFFNLKSFELQIILESNFFHSNILGPKSSSTYISSVALSAQLVLTFLPTQFCGIFCSSGRISGGFFPMLPKGMVSGCWVGVVGAYILGYRS